MGGAVPEPPIPPWGAEPIFWSSLALGLGLLGGRGTLGGFASCPLPSALGLSLWSRSSGRLSSGLAGPTLLLLASSLRSAKSEEEP